MPIEADPGAPPLNRGEELLPDAEEDEKLALIGSAKKSDGEKASGLLWLGESPLCVERAIDGAFFRTGRIQAGPDALGPEGASGRFVSKGMPVTVIRYSAT